MEKLRKGLTMIVRMLRGALVLVSSVLVVPYTIAVVSNILHGWPQGRNKYRRALHPNKVFALNYVLIQMLRDKAKYIPLYFKWRNFYRNADPRKLFKNLTFGRNDCTLDVYLPSQRDPDGNLPVLIFVYGGAWSSGDKSSYGLLCSNIATEAQAVVICPNYSLYPKGYVDDMIQDIVDSVSWAIENIHVYGGDKNKLILLGHSAGAHLATMAILELLHDERLSVKPSFKFQPTGSHLQHSAITEVSILTARQEELEDSSGSSESFAVVSENGSFTDQSASLLLEMGGTSMSSILGTSLDLVQSSHQAQGRVADSRSCIALDTQFKVTINTIRSQGDNGDKMTNDKTDEHRVEGNSGDVRSRSLSGSLGDEEDHDDDDSGDNDSVVTVRPKDIEKHATLVDMCKCIQAFIGLAGVYSIGEHFQHESMRGIEDVSCMSRAHYGEDHFARFSPKEIIQSLGRSLSLPLMVLAHGMNDYISPVSSTLSFAAALSDVSASVRVKVVPECDHYEICLGLMDKQGKFYSHIMNIIMETLRTAS